MPKKYVLKEAWMHKDLVQERPRGRQLAILEVSFKAAKVMAASLLPSIPDHHTLELWAQNKDEDCLECAWQEFGKASGVPAIAVRELKAPPVKSNADNPVPGDDAKRRGARAARDAAEKSKKGKPAKYPHDFSRKLNLVTNDDGSDTRQCVKCGLKKKFHTLDFTDNANGCAYPDAPLDAETVPDGPKKAGTLAVLPPPQQTKGKSSKGTPAKRKKGG